MTLKLREPEPLKLHASEYTGKKLFKFHSGQVFWHASKSITDNFLLLVVPCDSLKPQISRTGFLTVIYPIYRNQASAPEGGVFCDSL